MALSKMHERVMARMKNKQRGFFVPFGGGSGSYYKIGKALRFRGPANAYVTRSVPVAGNRKTWTWSGWVKRGLLSSQQIFFSAGGSASNRVRFYFNDDDTFSVFNTISNSNVTLRQTTAKFRDPFADIHIVVAWDSTQATANDRLKVYINGSQVTSFSVTNNVGLNNDGWVFSAAPIYLGHSELAGTTTSTYDGLISEFHLIEGLALGPGSFGYLDTATNSWRPKKYTGVYGANGSYLPFDDGTSLTTLGKDRSGNGNDWTCNGISLTAGPTYDWLDDTPTNKFATLSQVDNGAQLLNANLTVYSSGAAWQGARASLAIPQLKVQWEVNVDTVYAQVGVGPSTASLGAGMSDAGVYRWDCNGGVISYGGATQATIAVAVGDIIGVAVNGASGTVSLYKNGTLAHTFSQTYTGDLFPTVWTYQTTQVHVNFGQRPFTYPLAGFNPLCTNSLPDPGEVSKNPKKQFDLALYTGTNTLQAVSGIAFQPGLAWLKGRASAYSHGVFDTIRGPRNVLVTNTTNAEGAEAAGTSLESFDASGFTLAGGSAAYANVNTAGQSYVAWLWKAGGAAVANALGSIASQVSANVAAGFSIVAYSGTGTAGTIGHGLAGAPKLIIARNRSSSAIWAVYHADRGATRYLQMNSTAAEVTNTLWNNTAPNSSVFSVGGSGFGVNDSGISAIAYCFAEIAGLSKINAYSGTGSTVNFVWCGFRPRFILIKRVDAVSDWVIVDTSRLGYNVDNNPLWPNLANAEGTTDLLDVVSTGFTLRTTDASVNASGGRYVFYAISEQSLKYSNAR